tara:strand:- start:137 stop:712 length:576 start_codon:yes stop_codon:yes gene_type:complete
MLQKTRKSLSILTVIAGLVAIGMVTAPHSAKAQNFAEGLEGLKEMVLVVERLTEQSEACGLDRAKLAELMRSEVSNTGLVLAEAGPTLYLNINTAAVGEVCFSSVNLRVQYYTQVPHPTKAEGAIAQVTLWDDAFVASSELSNHGEYISGLIGDMAQDFVVDWREANPRTLLMAPNSNNANAPIMNTPPSQ